MPRNSEQNCLEHCLRVETGLLDAWRVIIQEHGYKEMTLTMVAEHTGVARNMVYGCFSNEADLLPVHLKREIRAFVQVFTLAVDDAAGSDERLCIIVEHLLRYVIAHPGSKRESAALSCGEHERILDGVDSIYPLISLVIREGRIGRNEYGFTTNITIGTALAGDRLRAVH